MKFTLSWLKEHLETDHKIEQIAEALTQLGLEVESVDDKAYLEPLKIAQIIEAAPHPNADKLQLLQVDIGEGKPLKIVCGAANARVGLCGVLAPIGTYLPHLGLTIQLSKIRGETSHGMMCSAAELGLPNDNGGILELPADAPIGESYANYAKLNDPVIEISVTPNRSDCTSVHGIARDLAAFGLGDLKELANQAIPDSIQQRLNAAGIKPQNNIQDCCNYIALDIGVPIIALNANKLNGDVESVELQDEEDFNAPNGKTYKLPPKTVVLKSKDGIEAVGGVTASIKHVFEPTMNNILLWSEDWNQEPVAIAGRLLGINNEQRYRAERGIDGELIPYAFQQAQQILGWQSKELGGPKNSTPFSIPFDPDLVKRLTSIEIAHETMYDILQKLGCAREGELITIPSWRHDLHLPVDLVEEIIRIHGLGKLEPQPLPPAQPRKEGQPPVVFAKHLDLSRLAKHGLAACGFSEILSWSFISHEQAKAFGGGAEELQLLNPIAANMSDMRPSLLPGLINTAVNSAARGQKDVALFELSHIYKNTSENGQELSVAALRQNQAKFGQQARHWRGNAGFVDIFDAKQDAISILDLAGINIDKLSFEPEAPSFYHPGRSGLIKLGTNVLGHFGELHPDICELFAVKNALAMFELDLETIAKLASNKKNTAYTPQLQQNIYRDLAFVVEESVEAAKLQKAAANADKLITKINVFDVFTGSPIEPGMKSVGLELKISPAQPLAAAQIEAICSKVIEAIYKQTGAQLRS
ncbi:MAG: phenylalanine--tRNA ligase subunit beta [Alphaproteobacteria bacterium]|nr:phenylalanine--tRNA ligase subunit beta [Alphaproteobacteria bacterium]